VHADEIEAAMGLYLAPRIVRKVALTKGKEHADPYPHSDHNEVHGLLDFIGVLSRKEDGRNVRLQKIHFRGMLRVDFGNLQGGYERREVHHRPIEHVIFENIKAFPVNCQGEKRLTAPQIFL
jgi:hypothetical protein